MVDPTNPNPPADFENEINRKAQIYSNVKTLAIAAFSAIGAVFVAGIYYNELRHKLDGYVTRIEKIEAQLSIAQTDISTLKGELSAERQKIRTAINNAFIQLLRIDNSKIQAEAPTLQRHPDAASQGRLSSE
jgi:hypothetical protein